MNKENSYINFNNWINEISSSPEKIQKINFGEILHKFSCLPKPDTDEKYQELIDSGVSYSLSDLFGKFTDNPGFDQYITTQGESNDTTIDRLNYYLINLWEIWEKFFIKNSWYEYCSFIVKTKQFKNRVLTLNFKYNNLFNKCNDCQKTDIKIPSVDSEAPELHVENFDESCHLSTIAVTGCEGFVYASTILRNEYVFERVYSHWAEPNIQRMQLLWIPFISCAGELGRADILRDIFRNMVRRERVINLT